MRVVVGIGSNLNAEVNIAKALQALSIKFSGLCFSTLYKSIALSNSQTLPIINPCDYLNMAVSFQADLAPEILITSLKKIETNLGRGLYSKQLNQVCIDLDLLLYGDEQVCIAGRYYPDQAVCQHSFILAPLADLVPDSIDCQSQLSYRQLWQAMDKAVHPLNQITLDTISI